MRRSGGCVDSPILEIGTADPCGAHAFGPSDRAVRDPGFANGDQRRRLRPGTPGIAAGAISGDGLGERFRRTDRGGRKDLDEIRTQEAIRRGRPGEAFRRHGPDGGDFLGDIPSIADGHASPCVTGRSITRHVRAAPDAGRENIIHVPKAA